MVLTHDKPDKLWLWFPTEWQNILIVCFFDVCIWWLIIVLSNIALVIVVIIICMPIILATMLAYKLYECVYLKIKSQRSTYVEIH